MKNVRYILSIFIVLFLVQCKKEIPNVFSPVVEVGSYSPSNQFATGQIKDIGPGLKYYGHIWDTLPMPVLDRFVGKTEFSDGNDIVPISSYLYNVISNKTYYIRAYWIDPFNNQGYSEYQIEYDPFNSPQNPVACFAVSRTECEVGTCSINFDASCAQNAIGYRWDFDGDGIFDVSGNDKEIVSHIFTSIGTYSVRLEITTMAGLKNSVTQTIQVNSPPPSKFRITLEKITCIEEDEYPAGEEYYGYTTVRLNINGENQEALSGTSPYSNPVPDVTNQYYMWARPPDQTIDLVEGTSYIFDESLNYEVSVLDIDTSQVIVYTLLEEYNFWGNDFIGDKTDTSNLSNLTVGETHYIIQELSNNDSKLDLYINIRRVE